MKPAKHPHEINRLAELAELRILDTAREDSFDDLTALAAAICEAPVAVVTFIDKDRQWFKSEIGLGISTTPLGVSICAHAILEQELLDIPDTLADARTRDNPFCGPQGFRAYAGAQLRTAQGLPLGTLCVLDRVPRNFTAVQKDALTRLAGQVMRLVEMRAALQQQILLRSEVNHRVKNSFQAASSLLSLQARGSDSEAVRQALAEASQRIGRIAAMHEALNSSHDDSAVDFPSYVHRLQQLFEQTLPGHAPPSVSLDPLTLNADQANAIGSIINEFVANAYKHACEPGEAADVTISGRRGGACYHLAISHGGAIAPDVLRRIDDSKGLGTRLIRGTARSLQWPIEWTFEDGVLKLTVTMPVPDQ